MRNKERFQFLMKSEFFSEARENNEDYMIYFYNPIESEQYYMLYVPKNHKGSVGWNGSGDGIEDTPKWFQEYYYRVKELVEERDRLRNELVSGGRES